MKKVLPSGTTTPEPTIKMQLSAHLEAKGYAIQNYGTNTDDSVDYPDFIHPVASLMWKMEK